MKFLIYILCFYSGIIISQTNTLDSLLNKLKTSNNDTNKVNLLNTIASEYFNQDPEKASEYTSEAIVLSDKLKFNLGKAKALNSLGILIQKKGNYDSAIVLQNQALNLYQQINNQKGIAKCYSDICIAHWKKADFSKALDYELKSLKTYENINDEKGIAFCYNMIGIIYKDLKKPEEAIKYYLQSAKIKKNIADEKGLASTYNNIGNVYKDKLNEDSSYKYYNLALLLHDKNSNLSGKSMVLANIGSLKFKLGKYQDALNYYLLGLDVEKQLADSNSIATSYINIGNTYTTLKQYVNARKYISDGLTILQKINDQEGVMSAYEMLAFLYQEERNFEEALNYYQKFISVRDSIMGNQEKEIIAEIQTKYEVEKKDLELAKNKAELEAKEKQTYFQKIIIISIILLLILIITSSFLYIRKKQTEQKAKLNEEISKQKEIRTKAILDAEEKERRRIAQDLHDGVGQLLSAAKINLSQLESKINIETEEQKTTIQNALSLVDDSVKEVRTVSHNMMPNTLLKLGLASAVREFITKLGNAPSLKVDLEIVGLDSRLDNQTETVMYRVIQEIVNNIIKHAKASHISLQLIKHDDELNVMIEDNGIGFDSSDIDNFEGIGIKGIFTRIEFLGGSVHFDSTEGRGTTVIIDIPLN
jgi:two-component system NarL family sensor kinase